MLLLSPMLAPPILRFLVLAVALGLPLVAPVAQTDATAAGLADLRLASAVRLALATDVRTRGLDVDVAARAGTVTLSGLAPSARPAAADVARAVPGVLRLDGDEVSQPPAAGRPVAEAPVLPVGREALPERPTLREEGDVAYHTVARGETLFSLARRYGTSVEAVMRLNGMETGEIRVGQRLRMR